MRLIHGTARHPSGWGLGILQGEEPQVGPEGRISWAGDGRLAPQPSPEAVGAVSGFGGGLPSVRHCTVLGEVFGFQNTPASSPCLPESVPLACLFSELKGAVRTIFRPLQ